jgi:hypothetical protein
MTRLRALSVFTALAALAVSGCDCRGANTANSFGELVVVWRDADNAERLNRDATYDFGNAFVGERIAKKLIVRNVGARPLTLVALEKVEGNDVSIADALIATSAFDVRFEPNTIVGASEQVEFDMYFTPRAGKDATNPIEAFLSVLKLSATGTRAEDATALVTLKGNGEAGNCLIPKELDFGPVPVGETFELRHTFTNRASVTGHAYIGDPTGGDAAAFAVKPGEPKGDVTMTPNFSLDAVYTFSPTEMRAYSSRVKMKGPGDCPEAEIDIKGSGTDEVLSWAPSSLNFGYVSPGVAAPKKVLFTNLSKAPITLRNINTTQGEFFIDKQASQADATTFVVAGGGVTEMTVYFKPAVLGPKTGTLNFSTGLKKNPQGAVALQGMGGGPSIRVTPRPTLAFGKVGYFPGTSFNIVRKISVMNVGTKPNPPDKTANLYLGQVDPVSGPGQLPFITITPKNANTDANEFVLNIPSNYDFQNGIEATAGKNVIDLTVVLSPQSLGLKEAELKLFSNDPVEPEITLTLTADAQQLPPCNYQVTPGSLNFGLVTPPQFRDLPLSITNLGQNAGDVCYLSGIEIAAGSDPAFSIVGGAIASKELQPKETLSLTVRIQPAGAVPNGLLSLNGNLQFNVTSPTSPQVNVPLSASVGPVCLSIAPDTLDFGTVKKGCNSSTRQFSVYNICNSTVYVSGFAMQAGAGQPAGGPDCPGTANCPEFHLTQTPPIPAGNLAINPGAAPVTFQAKYTPIDVGTDTGAISINAIQSGQPVTYLVSLAGTGDLVGKQKDSFQQDLQPKADILLAVDDSCSMSDKQTNLANNFNSFIQYAVGTGVDWQLGTITTSDDEPPICINGFCPPPPSVPAGGKLIGDANNPKILKPSTPGVQSKFSSKVQVGTNGGTEVGLTTSLKALTPPLIANENVGLLRYDANLAIVVVSDAGDQSPEPYSYFYNRFLNIKGFNRASMFTFNVIGPFLSSAPSGCTYDDYTNSATYQQMATNTSGVINEICTPDWAAKLQDLGKTAFGFRTAFFLNSTPDFSGGKTLDVKINGQTVSSSDWTYDAATNAVKFTPTKTPGPGQSLTVEYFTACF